jgi:hypothetical protein
MRLSTAWSSASNSLLGDSQGSRRKFRRFVVQTPGWDFTLWWWNTELNPKPLLGAEQTIANACVLTANIKFLSWKR